MSQVQNIQPVSLSDTFLAELVQELDHEDIIGITLGGSYARDAATPYSDIDLACFWSEGLSETLAILRPIMNNEHLAVVEQTLEIVREAVDELPFSEQERQWLKNWT